MSRKRRLNLKIKEYTKTYSPYSPEEIRRTEAAFDWARSVVLAVTVMFVIFTFFIRPCKVIGDSMLDTLQDGNWLLCTAFDMHPKYGEIVIITQPNTGRNEPIVKRLIATEGQTVDIDFSTGEVTVDGETLYEPYIREQTRLKQGVDFPLTVPEGCLFVMGDNRNHSKDSRSTDIGFIDKHYVLGRVFYRVLPFDRAGCIGVAEKQLATETEQ